MTERFNGNMKIVMAILIPLLAAAVGFGVLKQQVAENSRDVQAVELRATAQLNRIEANQRRLEDKVDRLLERVNQR